MKLKVIICFLVFNFIHPSFAFSVEKDSIKVVKLSEKLILNEVNGRMELQPNEYSFFDVDVDRMYVSFELQRLNQDNNESFVFLEIKKKSLQQYRLRPIISKKIELSSSTHYIDSLYLPDSLFTSGNFDVIVNYMSDSFKVLDVKKSPFQLLRNTNQIVKEEFYTTESDKPINNVDIGKTFVAKYKLDELKRNILALKPLAKGVEQNVIKEISLSDDELILKQFFYNFWYNRNSVEPEKAWKDYFIILNDLAKKYGTANLAGYETDRGRIYIQYGVPDRLIRVPNEKGALPYEVWFYYKSGLKSNLKFLFFQAGILSNEMLLLHSNMPEEVINPYWKILLLSNPDDPANKLTHKVFEFFN